MDFLVIKWTICEWKLYLDRICMGWNELEWYCMVLNCTDENDFRLDWMVMNSTRLELNGLMKMNSVEI